MHRSARSGEYMLGGFGDVDSIVEFGAEVHWIHAGMSLYCRKENLLEAFSVHHRTEVKGASSKPTVTGATGEQVVCQIA